MTTRSQLNSDHKHELVHEPRTKKHQRSLSSPEDTIQNIRWDVVLPPNHVILKWYHPTVLRDSRKPPSKETKTSTKELHDSTNIHVTQLTNTSDSNERVSSHGLRWLPWQASIGPNPYPGLSWYPLQNLQLHLSLMRTLPILS